MSSRNQKIPLVTQPVDIRNYKGSPVSADNPIQTTMPEPASTPVTVGDGGNVVEGAIADAAIITDTTGTINGKLRGLIKLILAKITVKLDTGSNVIGKVGIDQTTTGTTNAVDMLDRAARDLGKVDVASLDQYTPENSRLPVSSMDFGLEVARGRVSGIGNINKFGAAPDGIQTTATDIWSRANSTPTQQIWLAPTAARVHAIVSTSADDDGDPVGIGARTIRIYGLKTWDLAETTEDVILDGTTPVNTAQSYVIIHRMKVLTCGASGPNVGTISATAATDTTITAVILPGDGQTEMAIYGVPSIQTLYLARWGCHINKNAAAAATADFQLRVNENPNVLTTCFLRKDDISLQSNGTSAYTRLYPIPPSFPGPCIIKVQATASAADIDGKSGFDGYLVTN